MQKQLFRGHSHTRTIHSSKLPISYLVYSLVMGVIRSEVLYNMGSKPSKLTRSERAMVGLVWVKQHSTRYHSLSLTITREVCHYLRSRLEGQLVRLEGYQLFCFNERTNTWGDSVLLSHEISVSEGSRWVNLSLNSLLCCGGSHLVSPISGLRSSTNRGSHSLAKATCPALVPRTYHMAEDGFGLRRDQSRS